MSVSLLTMRATVLSMSECGCIEACVSWRSSGFSPLRPAGIPLMTLTMLPPCVGAYLAFVGSEEPDARCRVEFCGRFHAHEGAQSEVGEGHERAGDAAGAEGSVELLVADDRHDGGVVEAGFDAFGLPCAAVAAAQVDLAWQPYVEAGDVAVFVFVTDGHGRADPVVAPVP
jgi:hypothetical protein